MIVIDEWIGRFGNNIVQVLNAICIALECNCDIHFPKHDKFQITLIPINRTNKIIEKGHFFYRCQLDHKQEIYDNPLAIETLKKSGLFSWNDIKLTDKCLLIHIRSGDIFESNDCHPYVQPPLDFYRHIIDKVDMKRILIISEDTKNPVIDKLVNIYKQIELHIVSFEKTIDLIMNAHYVVFGYGSFIPASLIFSKKIKKVYFPDYLIDFSEKYKGKYAIEDQTYLLNYLDCKKEIISTDGYLKKMGGFWKNNSHQLKIMVDFKIDS